MSDLNLHDLAACASEDELTDSDPDCSQNDATEPRSTKRPKVVTQGAAVYKTKFNKEWSKVHPFIKEVKGNTHKFLCTICSREVSCGHMGKADPKGTLSSILTIKLARTEPAHCFEPSKATLSKAKSATYEYNKAHIHSKK